MRPGGGCNKAATEAAYASRRVSVMELPLERTPVPGLLSCGCWHRDEPGLVWRTGRAKMTGDRAARLRPPCRTTSVQRPPRRHRGFHVEPGQACPRDDRPGLRRLGRPAVRPPSGTSFTIETDPSVTVSCRGGRQLLPGAETGRPTPTWSTTIGGRGSATPPSTSATLPRRAPGRSHWPRRRSPKDRTQPRLADIEPPLGPRTLVIGAGGQPRRASVPSSWMQSPVARSAPSRP